MGVLERFVPGLGALLATRMRLRYRRHYRSTPGCLYVAPRARLFRRMSGEGPASLPRPGVMGPRLFPARLVAYRDGVHDPLRRMRRRRSGRSGIGVPAKSARLYIVILLGWAGLMCPLAVVARPVAATAWHRNAAIGVLMVVAMMFISFFWLAGVKDVAFAVAYRVRLAGGFPLPGTRGAGWQPSVGLLYCTCNDFSAASLLESMRQDYSRCCAIILDDSAKPEMIAAVDEFSRCYGVPVSRRPDRAGFKAGNLNWYLRRADLDYFVLLDADEVITPDFVSRCLDYFAAYPAVGVVQANHVATRSRTAFMRTFAPGVDAQWPATQVVKAFSGFVYFYGHGAMVDMACYNAVGGFPPVVAEDLCFAVEARNSGWLTVFAPDITCEEEFPIDYAAFKKRHRKQTEGSMEVIRKYSPKIVAGRMPWYEKLDIVLSTYSLPLAGVFGAFYVVANAIILPLVGFRYHYPLWMLLPTLPVASLIHDLLAYLKRPTPTLLSYLLHSVMLLFSMYFVSLQGSIKSAVGRSIFHVTPKSTSGRDGLWPSLQQNMGESICANVLAGTVAATSGSLLTVLLLVLPVVCSVYLTVMNSRPGSHRKGWACQDRTRLKRTC